MICPGIDLMVEQSRERYDAFLVNLDWSFKSGLLDPRGITQQTISSYRQTNEAAAAVFIEREKAFVDLSTRVMFDFVSHNFGYQTIEDSAVLNAANYYLEGQMLSQIMRDLVEVDRALSGIRMNGLSKFSGQVSPVFQFQDRLGRKTSSSRFVAGVWRMGLLSVHNEAVLEIARTSNVKIVDILRSEGDLYEKVGEVSVTPGPGGLQGYADIRDAMFHPNSRSHLWIQNV